MSQRDGQPRPGADARPGLALAQAAAHKRRTHPELQPRTAARRLGTLPPRGVWPGDASRSGGGSAEERWRCSGGSRGLALERGPCGPRQLHGRLLLRPQPCGHIGIAGPDDRRQRRGRCPPWRAAGRAAVNRHGLQNRQAQKGV